MCVCVDVYIYIHGIHSLLNTRLYISQIYICTYIIYIYIYIYILYTNTNYALCFMHVEHSVCHEPTSVLINIFMLLA